MILRILYSARNDNKVVNEAAPAIKGNTSGTIVADPQGLSFLNISTPKIISTAKTSNTKAPATAKEEISTLNNPNNAFPINKKATNITKETIAAFPASIF